MKKRCALLLALLAVVSGLLQGCWNYREIDSLMIVAGLAVDRGYEGYKYHLTIDLADTSNAGKDKPVVSTLVEAEGDSIFEAVRNSLKRVGMKLYWQNCQIVIISQDVARESISPVIDWLNRDAEPRLTMEVFVSQEQTAKEVLQQRSTTMAITSFEIDKLYEQNEKVRPVAEYHMLYDIYNTLHGKGKALVLPALRVTDNIGDKVCTLNGMAVFDGDRLIGYLTADDSGYAMFATNHIQGGVLDVKAPTGNTIAALEIYSSTASITPAVENGKLRVRVQIGVEAAVDELDTAMDYLKKEKRGELEFLAESQLAANVGRAVQIVQSQYGLDIFGFGDELHRSDAGAWYALEKNWNEAFKSAKVEISCKIKIRNSAESKSSVKGGG